MALPDFPEKLLDHVLRNIAYGSPSTVYVALFTSDPGETGAGGDHPPHWFEGALSQQLGTLDDEHTSSQDKS